MIGTIIAADNNKNKVILKTITSGIHDCLLAGVLGWNYATYTFNENQPIKDFRSDMWLSLVQDHEFLFQTWKLKDLKNSC